MPEEYYSKSPDQELEATLEDLLLTGILWFGKTGETDPDLFNRHVQLATLRDFLLNNSSVEVDVDSGDGAEIPVVWPTAYSSTPTALPAAPAFYSATGGNSIFCAYKPGSLTTTGVTVVLSSPDHGDGKLAVPLPMVP